MELAPYQIAGRAALTAPADFWVQTMNSRFTLSARWRRPYEECRVEELRLALINYIIE